MGSLLGVDEAGRGPVMGPLIVAGFKLDSELAETRLEELRVRDSKKCTPQRRERLGVELRKMGQYYIKTVSAKEIDEYRKRMTLNRLEGELFAEVINQLVPDENTTIIVDAADSNADRFGGYIKAKVKTGKIISKHKADDNYLIVAAASILAKTERDAQVKRIGEELNMNIGSGYPADPITVNFLEKWIKEKGDLPPNTRHSWNTSKKLLEKHRRPIKTLDQFCE